MNFIAMEMMGCAAVHKDELWVDYPIVFKKMKSAIDCLISHGIDVQLYNFPLCAVERGYWHIAVKSITDICLNVINVKLKIYVADFSIQQSKL